MLWLYFISKAVVLGVPLGYVVICLGHYEVLGMGSISLSVLKSRKLCVGYYNIIWATIYLQEDHNCRSQLLHIYLVLTIFLCSMQSSFQYLICW